MQHNPRISIVLVLAFVCAITLLPGCGPITQRADVEERIPENPQQAYDRGAYREAARLWEKRAMEVPQAEATPMRLRAMDAWLLAGDTETAQSMVPWIDPGALSDANAALFNLLTAELALADGDPVGAQRSLDQARFSLPEEFANRYQSASNRTQVLLGSLGAQNVRQASELVQGLQGYDAESALQLMHSIEGVTSAQLAHISGMYGDVARAAWFDLALTLRQNLVHAEQLEEAVRSWKYRHPDFTVSEENALDLWLRYRQTFVHPERVAALLPDSGGLKGAGAAIRDGIMSAYLSQPGRSEIRFYDTGSAPEIVLASYFEAADGGADWIIGPLARPSIEALLGLAGLTTPVLALNELPDGSRVPAGLEQQVFGMSLSQEKEAAAVAQRMRKLGMKKTLMLTPASEWGDRITQSFEEEFLQAQGETLVAARYFPEENDHSQVLEDILQIAESKERKTRLENRLQTELEFEPVRRSDIDSIFLAANPEQGRQLTPQLRFFDVGSLPTYSISQVFTGEPDPARNQDLNGLHLPLTSWQLEHTTPESIPEINSLRGGRFAPLFAIGMDAWNILPWLRLMRSDPGFQFAGQSAVWSIDTHGDLVREPYWGQFRGGRPVMAEIQAP